MSDDRETSLRIGRGVHRGGGGSGGSGSRNTTVRNPNLAANLRNNGVSIGTEKKYNTPNKAGPSNGQFHTKVDRSNDIIAQKTISPELKEAIAKGRQGRLDQHGDPAPLSQRDLGIITNFGESYVRDFEDKNKPAQGKEYVRFRDMAGRILGIRVVPPNIGQRILTKTQQLAVEAREKAEAEERAAEKEAKRIKEEEEAVAKAAAEEDAVADAQNEETAANAEQGGQEENKEKDEDEDETFTKAKGKGKKRGKAKGKAKAKARADEEDEDEDE